MFALCLHSARHRSWKTTWLWLTSTCLGRLSNSPSPPVSVAPDHDTARRSQPTRSRRATRTDGGASFSSDPGAWTASIDALAVMRTQTPPAPRAALIALLIALALGRGWRRLKDHYVRRLAELPEPTQQLMLLAAASDECTGVRVDWDEVRMYLESPGGSFSCWPVAWSSRRKRNTLRPQPQERPTAMGICLRAAIPDSDGSEGSPFTVAYRARPSSTVSPANRSMSLSV